LSGPVSIINNNHANEQNKQKQTNLFFRANLDQKKKIIIIRFLGTEVFTWSVGTFHLGVADPVMFCLWGALFALSMFKIAADHGKGNKQAELDSSNN
jgi:hypothetical protein